MLTKVSFFKRLLLHMFESSEHEQIKILDILNWIFYNNLTESSNLHELKQIFIEYLEQFIQVSYLGANRSVAKKATSLLTFLLK